MSDRFLLLPAVRRSWRLWRLHGGLCLCTTLLFLSVTLATVDSWGYRALLGLLLILPAALQVFLYRCVDPHVQKIERIMEYIGGDEVKKADDDRLLWSFTVHAAKAAGISRPRLVVFRGRMASTLVGISAGDRHEGLVCIAEDFLQRYAILSMPVIAHEIGHLANDDRYRSSMTHILHWSNQWVLWIGAFFAAAKLGAIFLGAASWDGANVGCLVAVVIGAFALSSSLRKLLMKVNHAKEFAADAIAVRIMGDARPLIHLFRILRGMDGGGTTEREHPPLDRRIEALEGLRLP